MAEQLKREYDFFTYGQIFVTLALGCYALDKGSASAHFLCDETHKSALRDFVLCIVFYVGVTVAYLAACLHFWSKRHTEYFLSSLHLAPQLGFSVYITILLFQTDLTTPIVILVVQFLSFFVHDHLSNLCEKLRSELNEKGD